MKRDMKKWMTDLANSRERHAMPIMTYPGLELTGMNITDVIKDGEEQFKCIEALANKYPSAAAVTIMDLSVEAEAFGSPIRYSDKDVPTVTSRIVDDFESVLGLEVPEVGSGRTLAYVNAAELAAKNVRDRPVFGGHIGPISLASRLFDMTELMMALVLEPQTIHTLLKKCTAFLIKYAKAFKESGANGIIIAEPAAGLLSPEQSKEFSYNYVKSIVDAVQDDKFMIILHNCGNTKNQVSGMLETGSMGFHFGNAVDMIDIMPQVPWGRIAFGNIDPAGVFKNGSAQDMKTKVWQLLEKTATYKNFVLSSGCDVPPGTPNENIDAFYETLETFNRTVLNVGVA